MVTTTERLPYNSADFRDKFWSKFSPQSAADIILDPRPTFNGYKDILLAALLAWSLQPSNPRFRRSVTVAAVTRKLIQAEKEAIERGVNYDFHARYVKLGPEFITELYYGIGGAHALAKTDSTKSIKLEMISKIRAATNIVEVIRIYHELYDNPSCASKASLRGAYSVFDFMWQYHSATYSARGFTPYVEGQLKVCWAEHYKSSAHLYAASQTVMTSNKTLLSELLNGRMVIKSDAPWVKNWLTRTAHAVNYLSNTYESSIFPTIRRFSPSCDPQMIARTGLSEVEISRINQVFQRDK